MKNRTTAGLLAVFLGSVGAHKYYLGKPFQAILYLLLCWTFLPGVIGVIEGFFLLIKSDADFNAEYNPGLTGVVSASGTIRPTPETHVKCPDCRELVMKDARKCRHCGCELIPQV